MGKTCKIFIFDKNRERDVEIIEEANYYIPYSGLFFIEPCATEESSTVTRALLGEGVQFS